jgi:uncharacterized protein
MTNVEGVRTPSPVMGLYDAPMWASIRAGSMQLQQCDDCGKVLYPPGPVCPHCLSSNLTWKPVSGRGKIISWVIFHRTYLPAYPEPYNVIAVQLADGPLLMSNLEGPEPEGNWIGRSVRMTYATMPDGFVLPRFVLDETART